MKEAILSPRGVCFVFRYWQPCQSIFCGWCFLWFQLFNMRYGFLSVCRLSLSRPLRLHPLQIVGRGSTLSIGVCRLRFTCACCWADNWLWILFYDTEKPPVWIPNRWFFVDSNTSFDKNIMFSFLEENRNNFINFLLNTLQLVKNML